MITIILTMLIGIILGVRKGINDYYDFVEWVIEIFVECAVGFCVGIIIAFILPMDLEGRKKTFSIETLQDGNSLSGNFFLGCGNVEGKINYVLYYKDGDYYKMMQIDADLVSIVYSNQQPSVQITTQMPTESWINWFGLSSDFGDKTYVISIPKGTIKNVYNLDAQ